MAITNSVFEVQLQTNSDKSLTPKDIRVCYHHACTYIHLHSTYTPFTGTQLESSV